MEPIAANTLTTSGTPSGKTLPSHLKSFRPLILTARRNPRTTESRGTAKRSKSPSGPRTQSKQRTLPTKESEDHETTESSDESHMMNAPVISLRTVPSSNSLVVIRNSVAYPGDPGISALSSTTTKGAGIGKAVERAHIRRSHQLSTSSRRKPWRDADLLPTTGTSIRTSMGGSAASPGDRRPSLFRI